MISTDQMSPAELAALLHFHADSGVEWLLEDAPVDRFAEFENAKAARAAGGASARSSMPASPNPPAERQAERPSSPARAPVPVSPPVAIPDGQAVAEAQRAANAAGSLPDLKTAMAAFNGCNLKISARNLVFADGNAASGVMVIGPMPNGDDDRDGIPFSGKQGQMLKRMLGAIGLDRQTALLTNVIPWRPPGNRVPSPREAEICRPFIERQIGLAEPRLILVLGNYAARFFFGGNEMIHHMRGQWRDLTIGGASVSMLATLHPQDLISAPASKRLAWQDLLAFHSRLRG